MIPGVSMSTGHVTSIEEARPLSMSSEKSPCYLRRRPHMLLEDRKRIPKSHNLPYACVTRQFIIWYLQFISQFPIYNFKPSSQKPDHPESMPTQRKHTNIAKKQTYAIPDKNAFVMPIALTIQIVRKEHRKQFWEQLIISSPTFTSFFPYSPAWDSPAHYHSSRHSRSHRHQQLA
jgi:hypothetical protein